MAKSKDVKTNAMRILDREKIEYESFFYECEEFEDGIHTADMLGLEHKLVYKTIVTKGHSGNYYVFVLPIEKAIELKTAAKSVGEKSIELLPLKDVLSVTGYVRGGCTAIGMKKRYETRVDISAAELPYIMVSAGRIGAQLKLKPEDLIKASKAKYDDFAI